MGPSANPGRTPEGPGPHDVDEPDSDSGTESALPDDAELSSRQRVVYPDTDEVAACPECDLAPVRLRQGDTRATQPDKPFACDECGWRGCEYTERESKSDASALGVPTPSRGTPARELLEADPDVIPDGGTECFYCQLERSHPTCDRPDCQVKVHGHGPEGKRTYSHCEMCRGGHPTAILPDGGEEIDPKAVINHDELPGTEHDELALNVARAYADHVNRGADPQEAAGCVSGLANNINDEAGVPPEVRVGALLAAYDIDLEEAKHIARLMSSGPEHTGGLLSRLRRVAAGWFA